MARLWILVSVSMSALWLLGAPVCRAADSAKAPATAAATSSESSAAPGGHVYKPSPAEKPSVAPASDEGQKNIATFKIPEGLKLSLWAAEPMLANPVCLSVDEKGRIYIGETYRVNKGVEDDRGHMDWLDEDMASHKVEDRLAMFKKHLGPKIADYSKHDDRIRLLEDRSGGGKADHVSTFADGFNDPLQGIGAGLLARRGDVYYTCIPDLWLLRDTKGTGVADVRKSLSYGYGTRVSFLGHDLHGLIFGPDGKLYFSLGDRGFYVKSGDKILAQPDTGAVFRCNPDGSDVEQFCYGTRNPQKLAFDECGNLFTCDNNSDSGDRARWTYLVEGADIGWRMPYQYLNDRGPFNREKIWYPAFEGQQAYTVPPVAWVADGPSGLVYYPGTGWDDRWQGHFFLADFKGGAGFSGVRSVTVKPKGATFELVQNDEFLWHMLATDVAWGPDGGLYVTDWVEGWDGCGKGRVYKLFDPAKQSDTVVAQTRQLLSEGIAKADADELLSLLAHPDMRVRQEAQFALTEKKASDKGVQSRLQALALEGAAVDGRLKQLSRIHAIWALGQIARRSAYSSGLLAPVVKLLADADAEIRAQAAKTLGDCREKSAVDKLLPLLKDESLRVRHLAAIAVGKLGAPSALAAAVELLRDNNDKDPVVRHSAVMALLGAADAKAIEALAADESAAVRLGAVVALRRLESAAVAKFLHDSDPRVVLEAARAINDAPIDAALPQLAKLISEPVMGDATVKDKISKEFDGRDALLRRVLNANYRAGDKESAAAVAHFAARRDVPDESRIEALEMLAAWGHPSPHDRVTNFLRPLPSRDEKLAADALRPELGGIFAGDSRVRQAAAKTAGTLGIKEVAPVLVAMATEPTHAPDTRIQAMQALEQLRDARLDGVINAGLGDSSPQVRDAALRILASVKPADALAKLTAVLEKSTLAEQQGALATLGAMKTAESEAVLDAWLDKLISGEAPKELRLDILEAATARKSAPLKEKLARYEAARPKKESIDPYRETLFGGDAARGKAIFFEKVEAQCVRCHTISGVGGKVGPELTKISADKPREYLLQSIVDPNKVIAKGFETLVLTLDDGRTVAGILKAEDAKQLTLMTPQGKEITVPTASVEDRARGKSAMPEDIAKPLTKAELRDLVEYLSTLK